MKIAQLMTSTSADFENRKRAIQRKEMGEAYKKTAQYQSPKNPMLDVLENLLSGKADKELHAADQAQRELETQGKETNAERKPELLKAKEEKLEQPEVKSEVRKLKVTEQEVIAHEQAHKSVGGEVSINAGEGSTPEETIQILEKVRAAALAPAQPSPQDLRVAASAASQIQQASAEVSRGEYAEALDVEENPFQNVDTSVEVPDRFLSNFDERDATEETVFGQELENLLFQRTFNKAAAKYSSHIAMVKNGYRPFEEPIFSQIA